MPIKNLLKEMVDKNASDLFYRPGGVARMRIDGRVVPVDGKALSVDDVVKATEELTSPQQRKVFNKKLDIDFALDVDFALYIPELSHRFRVSIFMQRNWPSIVVRSVRDATQSFEELGLPAETLRRLSLETRGLVLLTGTMGSGKSTTIASMIEYINEQSKKHILTIEEPVEFTFKDKNCIINQRELGIDVTSYSHALRAFTLQSPDVIFIGNIRDHDTMSAALTSAETGVLVLSTLHTINASQSVERIVSIFPPYQHQQIRAQLAVLLKGVISLKLVPKKDGNGRVPAYEVMILTPTISRLIREGKTWEIPQYISDGALFGMQTFNQSLVKLAREGAISEETATEFADNKEEFLLALRGIQNR
jgi:twitching motility protein PilT